jgi:hypothetical protein
MAKSIVDIKNRKRGVGRPKTGIGPIIALRLYPDMQAELEAWIAAQDDQPSRPEAIRRLLGQALAAAPKRARGK